MDKVRIYYDPVGNTLNVWFDDPQKEVVAEETGEEVILAKDRDGRVIGFERLNYSANKKRPQELPVEVVVAR